ncbi:alpha/beta fold hydrolase [Mycolicibacterium houstonense]|uniref:alpha/beta fold hydrolase n=1 Tax=Mycolicibacterium houstonense TaxID=146021 RepID=UPI0008354377|nr:alpha/beta hydrolase [Mycolicibacterium houstonense]
MAERAPIHLGSGEPILLLHPFLLSQSVWKYVAPQLAQTGRYEVFAPTMAGHHGGAHAPHIPFELERRGRARTLTGIAPAGGWSRFTPAKYEIIAKFMAALPLVLATAAFRQQLLKLPLTKQISYLAVSATPEVLNDSDRHDLIEDLAHCPAYFKLMVKALTTAGLMEIKNSRTPTQLVICEKDRVLPAPRFTRHFTASLAPDAVVKTLKGVGHVPMFEAPDTITQVITEFVDRHIDPARATG